MKKQIFKKSLLAAVAMPLLLAGQAQAQDYATYKQNVEEYKKLVEESKKLAEQLKVAQQQQQQQQQQQLQLPILINTLGLTSFKNLIDEYEEKLADQSLLDAIKTQARLSTLRVDDLEERLGKEFDEVYKALDAEATDNYIQNYILNHVDFAIGLHDAQIADLAQVDDSQNDVIKAIADDNAKINVRQDAEIAKQRTDLDYLNNKNAQQDAVIASKADKAATQRDLNYLNDVNVRQNAVLATKADKSELDAKADKADLAKHKEAIEFLAQVDDSQNDVIKAIADDNAKINVRQDTTLAKHEEAIEFLAQVDDSQNDVIKAIADDNAKINVRQDTALAKHKEAIEFLAQVDDSQNERIAEVEDKKADKTELAKKADQTALLTLSEKVTQNTRDIADINAVSRTDLDSIEATVNSNRSGVAVNKAAIADLDQRVTKVTKDMKRGLASQAALGGLFQPYSIGKVNITAAVGGYGSENALAVGMGYRFDKNIAAKAGVAASTSGGLPSYNVGINYEW